MSKIYLFDVDGTLTPAKSRIDEKFRKQLLVWMEDREVYIVSGGSFVRIMDQLGTEIVNKTEGVFACMGNIFYRPIESINPTGSSDWEIVYENKFRPPRGLYKDLCQMVEESEYYVKTGNHYEERVGMVNFSIVGRNANEEERHQYENYDLEHAERAKLVEQLKQKYDSIDFVIGGAVSIDIFRTGDDKSQVIEKYFAEALESNEILFVGDRVAFPGNDHSLAVVLEQHSNGSAYEVKTWEDTAELLKTEPFA